MEGREPDAGRSGGGGEEEQGRKDSASGAAWRSYSRRRSAFEGTRGPSGAAFGSRSRRESLPNGGRAALRRTGSMSKAPRTFHRSLSQVGTAVAHYAKLVVAEHPLEQHREFQLGRLEEEGTAGEEAQLTSLLVDAITEEPLEAEEAQALETLYRSELRARWRQAGESVMSSARLLRNAMVLADEEADGADRFAALVTVECLLHGNPHKKALMRALAPKRGNRTDAVLDMIFGEILQTGEWIFDFFTPAAIGQHRVFFTYGMTAACFFTFFYMIGAFPLFALQGNPAAAACVQAPPPRRTFLAWMFHRGAAWCFQGPAWVMSTDYLRAWGARYGPLMRQQPSRWFSSWFVHQSFLHVTSNMALFVVVAHQTEEKYGSWRVALLYFISALGGNFFSAAFEGGCKTVQGASGGVFGMMGLFIADLVLNFETVKRPLLRGLLLLVFLIYFIIGAVTGGGSSSAWSHIGGFLCGLFPSFLFLPNLRSERWEQVLPLLGGLVLVGVFTALPVYFYKEKLPRLECTS